MRLICPSCDAQYKVPSSSIPELGRDVQCSNCGHIWLETRKEELSQATTPTRESRQAELERERSLAKAQEAENEALQQSRQTQDDVLSAPYIDVEEEKEQNPFLASKRQPIDPSVAQILQEEAAHSMSGSAHSQIKINEQNDTNIKDNLEASQHDDTNSLAQDSKTNQAQLTRPNLRPAKPKNVRATPLPDVNEVQQPGDRDAQAAYRSSQDIIAQTHQHAEFKRGFTLALSCLAFLCAIYVFSDAISSSIPALHVPLERYTASVDHLRLWIDQGVRPWLPESSIKQS